MNFIVDASVLFSALIKRNFTFDLLETLSDRGHRLYSPMYLLEEINSKRERLLKFSKLTGSELDFMIEFLLGKITIVPEYEYAPLFSEARRLAPHTKDVPYFALALRLRCAIFSDEKAFKNQSKVKIYSTSELVKELGVK